MKKIIYIFIILSLLAWGLQAIDINLGLFFGTRSVKDSQVKEVYGNGSVYFPYVSVGFWKGLFAGFGYEGGYNRDGEIGLYQKDSSLKVSGVEIFAGYRFDLNKFSPYLKLGLGSYSYTQIVSGTAKFDKHKTGLTLAGGTKFYPAKGLFLAGEIKYVPLKVKPLEIEIDLGGIRFAIGIGYTF